MGRAGQYARIYKQPFLQKEEEGLAILIEKISEDMLSEFWRVEFVDTGSKVARRIIKCDWGL